MVRGGREEREQKQLYLFKQLSNCSFPDLRDEIEEYENTYIWDRCTDSKSTNSQLIMLSFRRRCSDRHTQKYFSSRDYSYLSTFLFSFFGIFMENSEKEGKRKCQLPSDDFSRVISTASERISGSKIITVSELNAARRRVCEIASPRSSSISGRSTTGIYRLEELKQYKAKHDRTLHEFTASKIRLSMFLINIKQWFMGLKLSNAQSGTSSAQSRFPWQAIARTKRRAREKIMIVITKQ